MLPRFHPRHLLRRWPERRPFDPSLVAYYSGVLGSGSVLYDESIYGNHGTIVGPTWADGKIRPALRFDGLNDYVTIPDSKASLNPTIAYTLEAWVKCAVLPSIEGEDGLIIIKRRQWGFRGERDTDVFHAFLWGWPEATEPRSTTVIVVGTWYHVVYTYDKVSAKIYINGALEDTKAHTDAIPTSSEDLDLGANDKEIQFFNGIIDEVRIYSRCLSEAEILRHYLRLA